jgi:hypothetical protein
LVDQRHEKNLCIALDGCVTVCDIAVKRKEGKSMTETSANVELQLRMPNKMRGTYAIEALILRGVHFSLANAAIEALARDSSHPIAVHVPMLPNEEHFKDEMTKAGLCVVFLTKKVP